VLVLNLKFRRGSGTVAVQTAKPSSDRIGCPYTYARSLSKASRTGSIFTPLESLANDWQRRISRCSFGRDSALAFRGGVAAASARRRA
jgi:hypothetical protein